MTALLDKIHAAKSSPMDMISSEDRAFIATQEAMLSKLQAQLSAWKQVIDKAAEELGGSPLVSMNKEWGTWRADKDFFSAGHIDKMDWVDAEMFSPAFAQAYINNTIDSAPHQMVDWIIDYFNETYNLSVKGLPEKCEPTAEKAIEWVIHCQGGVPLSDARNEATIAEMLRHFPSVSIDGDKVTVPASKRWTYDSLRGSSTLAKAVSLFEKETIDDPQIKSFFEGATTAGELYPCTATERFKSVKFYKNGKIELKFVDCDTARNFYSKFRLTEKKDR